jgi:hypothetical protein
MSAVTGLSKKFQWFDVHQTNLMFHEKEEIK